LRFGRRAARGGGIGFPGVSAVRVLAFLIGVILLLPGACALGFMALSIGDRMSLGPIPLLWLVCFLISAGGVALIRSALRGPPPRDPPT
jgi:hypothetical protein